jgi:hypothetical protein
MTIRTTLLAALFALPLTSAAADLAHPLSTVSERSGFLQTGRYEEVIALCDAFQKAYPKAVRCTTFGRTPEGRPMLAIVASRSGALDPKAARQHEIPVLLVQVIALTQRGTIAAVSAPTDIS